MEDKDRQFSENEEKEELKLSGDIITFGLVLLSLIVLFGVLLSVWWAIFWVGVSFLLGFVEYLSWKYSGKTLSETFGEAIRDRPAVGWSLWFVLLSLFLLLLYHFVALSK